MIDFDQRGNMNFNNFKGGVTNMGKDALMKKVTSKEDFKGMQDLGIHKANVES